MLSATASVGLLVLACLATAAKLPLRESPVAKRSIDLNVAAAHVDELPLPRLVTVNGYHLELQPFVEEGKFKGRVKINVTCQEATSTITVHAHPSLRIVSKPAVEISVREIMGEEEVLSSKTISVTGTRRDMEKQWYMINLSEKLKRTSMYQIDMRFDGDLASEKSDAFFRNSYIDKLTEETRWYAATKMSPTNARRVFPCFDEPMLKVPIRLSVARPEGMTAMSVMPVHNSEPVANETGWVWDHFETTPSMSTFSFGVVVTNLPQLMSVNLQNSKVGGVTIRVFGREEFKPELEKTVELAPKLVDFMQKYLDIAFPLPTLNILALPGYNEDETADHWGLILFKESNLMNGVGPWKLTYEIMDQWIGHLVTPHWWSDLRVANGLSNYLGVTSMLHAVCSESWRPASSYSIYYEYSKPHPFAGIPTMKEGIRVQSTQWLFRMLNYTLGEQTFRKGIQNFVRERQLETFFEDDIWSALTEEAKLENTLEDSVRVETITRTWMNEDRFPVVTVTRNYTESTAHLEQHLFLRTRPHEVADKTRLAWWLPLMMLTPDKLTVSLDKPTQWMQAEREMDISNLPSADKFIILNPDEIGMFMVNYDQRNWELLAEYLLSAGRKEVPMLDVGVRTKLLHDAWNLAYSGDLSFATALNMTLFLQYEREFPVWDVMYTMIDHVGRDIRHTEAGRKFQEYAQSLMIPMYESLAQEKKNESHSTTELRSMTKHFLCHVNYKPCIDTAMEVYNVWMQMPDPESGNPVPDNELCLVFKWGTMEEWEFGLLRVINFPSNRKQQERSNMIRSLAGCPRQSDKVERFLNVTILEGNGNFTESDVRLAINMLSGDAVGYTTLFNFLINNWDAIKQRFESKPHMWEYVVSKAVGSFKTQEGLNRVSNLYAERKGQFSSAESIVIEKMKKAIEEAKWTSEALPVMNAWLDKKLEADKAINGKLGK